MSNSTDFILKPIVLLTVPRSGSSMTASIFHAHGVWSGPTKEADEYNPHGYYESIPFLKEVHAYTKYATYPDINNYNIGWRKKVRSIMHKYGYPGGPWFMKHSARHFALWNDFKPKFVCIIRKEESIRQSWKKINKARNTKISIRKDLEAMAYLRKNVDHTCVFTDDVVRGDYSSLRQAFEYCGLEFNPEIAKEKIDPSIWHHR